MFEKCLKLNISPDDRVAATHIAVSTYASMGEYEKAKTLANKQDFILNCRECLLPSATSGEERDRYQGEALIALIQQLKNVMETAVMTKLSICQNRSGVQKFLDVAYIIESVFDDGRCGICHADLRDLYLWSAVFTARQGEVEKAREYFDVGFTHEKNYEEIRGAGVYQYSAPLVSRVAFPSGNFPAVPEDSWKGWLSAAPENLIAAIKADGRYAECFM